MGITRNFRIILLKIRNNNLEILKEKVEKFEENSFSDA